MTIFNKNTQPAKSDSVQIKESLRVLSIAISRIEIALLDGNKDVAVLTESFVGILNSAKQLDASVKALENSAEKEAIEYQCQQISNRVQSAIIAFQFYDKLSQRMVQASKILVKLTEVLNNQVKSVEAKTWQELENLVRSSYTLDPDLPLLNDILSGISVEDALKNAATQSDEKDIEFF